MEFASLIKEFAGPVGVLVLLLCLALILLKQFLAMLKTTAESISGVQKAVDERFKRQEEKDKEQDADIQYIKENYARKDDLYRELGGWKTELNRLSDRIEDSAKEQSRLSTEILQILAKNKEN